MTQYVYIVDDDEAIRDSLSWLFQSRNIACRTYDSAESFLGAWEASFAGCLLLDIRMGEMSGNGKIEIASIDMDGLATHKRGQGFTKGGICTLMQELGLYDLTPALCHLDYTMSEAGGATNSVRKHTLASGGPYCDCGYKKKPRSCAAEHRKVRNRRACAPANEN